MGNSDAIPDSLIEKIIQVASSTAIQYFENEKKKEDGRKRSEAVRTTKNQLKSYRKIKSALESERAFTEEEQAEYRWRFVEDLVGNARDIMRKSDRIIIDEEKRRQENLYCVYRIENAMELYREECEMSSREEEKRRYRVIRDTYISNEQLTAQEIAEREGVSIKSVYRDIGIGVSIIAIYLYGIEAVQ